ncbi:hypothetical protein BpHYR1_019729 [Brachionus plicatilis]|uniref:Uncharacterized protein n=1 Tax=Brachionus plicatilis TaxID=10195 RepID=A0A3M7PXL6_BRAPC|nr:hypothetical protein BpHYR1_019729 [Brachionus plicatilis]
MSNKCNLDFLHPYRTAEIFRLFRHSIGTNVGLAQQPDCLNMTNLLDSNKNHFENRVHQGCGLELAICTAWLFK